MAPQWLRVGPEHGRAALGVLVAALLVTALVVTGRSQDRTGRPPSPAAGTTAALDAPYRLGGAWRCPLRLPVLAMADGRSYPSWHPTRPPADARAIACQLLPIPARGTAQPDLCRQEAPCDNGTGFILRQEEFQVPAGYFGVDKQARGALELTAFSARRPTGVVNFACETERRIATVAVQGTRAVLVGCPGWSTSGQMMLRWTQAGTRISVSLQGTSAVNQALLTALATHLRLVRPAAAVRS